MGSLCFVMMPSGRKRDGKGREIDFDAVYAEIVQPAIEAAGLEPIRADEGNAGGFVHKPMLERLILCDVMIADLTGADPAVCYELGIRHGVRPSSTVLLFREGAPLPLNAEALLALPYAIDAAGRPSDAGRDGAALLRRLKDCGSQGVDSPLSRMDSPLYRLVSDFTPPDIARLKTDVFRQRVAYDSERKEEMAIARAAGVEALAALEARMNVADEDPALVVDLLLSYRAVRAWGHMIGLADGMAPELRCTTLVREQLGFALNRAGRSDDARRIIEDLIAERGPSSETNGILGRIHKDRWEEARRNGDPAVIDHLHDAITAYLAGFEADWRDAYPGINAVTLMEMMDPVDPRQAELLPVVRYAVKRRLAGRSPDYWDHATLLELAVLANDAAAARDALTSALGAIREPWEPETSARNLRLIRDVRVQRGIPAAWIRTIEEQLAAAAGQVAAGRLPD
jgi:hypothetical protein